MLVRLLLPALAWFALMVLIFFRTYENELISEKSLIGSDTLTQFVLFLGFSHIWMGVLKKQLKYSLLRNNAVVVVIAVGLFLAILLEILKYSFGFIENFSFVNLIFNFFGVFAGIGTFRLLYRSCC